MSKNKLEYNKQEPAFLRKLREQHGGPRNNVQIARPKKDRLRTGDEGEDDPVIVDEAGEDVAKDDWEERLRQEKEVAEGGSEDSVKAEGNLPVETRDKQKIADIGLAKKRKVGKVIVDGEEAEDASWKEKGAGPETKKDASDEAKTTTSMPAKTRKKVKKIKLSFDEPE
ncbi:uncharacterized protein HMPREF1541_09837 [Cyphellophora europaea CBS 101466]|uniref:DUF4604 domain-containing protein n=1 Tax=Cyphellophora europaea (strain CBS 101466) TaxID=1220924 RepID=W2S8G6_CYPE1|nr:uncharacterized protein HMPREF1541_09837 [Cyphellophora europaea CBS 101466]ETN44962.1 hypothetical protein HMPREF1541_09837 [Cyphellophora europaea CBS 101466]